MRTARGLLYIMPHMKKQTGPELGIILATIGGTLTVLWLGNNPGAWPHPLLAGMLAHLGHPLPVGGRALVGGVIAALACLAPGAWLDAKVKASQRRAASRRADREAAELDADRAARQAKQASMDTATVVRKMETAARGTNHATLKDLLWIVPGASVVTGLFWFFVLR